MLSMLFVDNFTCNCTSYRWSQRATTAEWVNFSERQNFGKLHVLLSKPTNNHTIVSKRVIVHRKLVTAMPSSLKEHKMNKRKTQKA